MNALGSSASGRSGATYLEIGLQDSGGEIRAKVFQDVETIKLEFDAGEFVKVQGRSNLYQGRLELILEKIRRILPERDAADGFREEDYIRQATRPVDDMWAELAERLASVEDPGLRRLLQDMAAANADRLRIWPAARRIHHAYRSGLLEHILKIMEVALFLAEKYQARRDLLIAGALLHDIGKLRELSYETATDYTLEGNLVGHITIGVGMLRDAADRPSTAGWVVLFPEDKAYWTGTGRRMQGVRPGTEGRFVFRSVPPGTYLVVAADAEPGQWLDPSFLEQIAPRAMRIVVREGEAGPDILLRK